MKILTPIIWILLTANVIGSAAIVSGPAPGTPLTPVMVYDGLGAFAGREFDAAAEIGNNPGAFLFVHSMTRNTYPVIRGLDQLAGRNALLGFRTFTVYLSADRTTAENQIRLRNGLATGGHRFSVTGKFGALKLENPIMLSLDGQEGPGNYALNRRAVLTLVTTRDGKVHRSHTFTDTGEHDLELLEELAAEVIGKTPTEPDAQRKLRDQRLPRDKQALRKLAVQFQAFWGLEYRRGHPMLEVVEEVTGPLPAQAQAMVEVVDGWLPTKPDELRAMALKQADELYRLQPTLNAAKAGQLRYTAMKPDQVRQMMQRQRMSGTKRKPTSAKTGRQTQHRGKSQTAEASGKPPTDPQLNQLMRALIRKTNTAQINAGIYRDIAKRSAESPQLKQETIAMFQFLLASDRYGNDDCRKLARQFLAEQ